MAEDKKPLKKVFGSRKFMAAMSAALTAILNDAFGFGISEETILMVFGLIATWILGESVADAAGAKKNAP